MYKQKRIGKESKTLGNGQRKKQKCDDFNEIEETQSLSDLAAKKEVKNTEETNSSQTSIEERLSAIERSLIFLVRQNAEISIKVSDIQQRCDGNAFINEEDLTKFEFPFNNIDEIIACDNKLLANKKAVEDLIMIARKVGGKNPYDAITGTLSKMFSNTVALLCSYNGQKGNFAVGRSYTIKCLKDYFCCAVKGTCTEKEFKTITINWFRVARQRLDREMKKKQ